jgi:anti-sigma B factor antagonist
MIHEQKITNGIMVLHLKGEFDLYKSSQLKKIAEGLESKNIKGLVIDCAAIQNIDSSGVGSLLSVYKRCQVLNINFRLSHIHRGISKILEFTRLKNYFPISQSTEDAVLDMKKAS